MSDRNSIVDHQSRRIATPIATNCDAAFNIWQSHDINSETQRSVEGIGGGGVIIQSRGKMKCGECRKRNSKVEVLCSV